MRNEYPYRQVEVGTSMYRRPIVLDVSINEEDNSDFSLLEAFEQRQPASVSSVIYSIDATYYFKEMEDRRNAVIQYSASSSPTRESVQNFFENSPRKKFSRIFIQLLGVGCGYSKIRRGAFGAVNSKVE